MRMRSTNIIRKNGKRVDISKLEMDIKSYMGNANCAVILKQFSTNQKDAVLFLQVKQGEEGTLDNLIESIQDADILDEIIPVSTLPLDNNGEVDKHQLEKLNIVNKKEISEACDFDNKNNLIVLYSEEYLKCESVHVKDILLKNKDKQEGQKKEKENKEVNNKKVAYVNGGEIAAVENDVNTLAEMLVRASKLSHDKGIYNIDNEGKRTFISYRELEETSLRVSRGLQERGIQKGDKVIILFDSNESYYYGLWGSIMGGIIPAPMTAPKNFSSSSNEIKSLKSVWETMNKPKIISTDYLIKNISSECNEFDFINIKDLKSAEKADAIVSVESDQVAVLMFTSGSTGIPKGVMQTHINISNKQRAAVQFSGYNKEDITLNWFSIEHVVGLIAFHIMPIYLGANQIQIATDYILEEPVRWMDLVTAFGATITWAPNSLFALLNDTMEPDKEYSWKLNTLKRVINAGESVNNETCRKFLKNLMPYGLDKMAIKPEWGMSETCCMTIASDVFCDGNEEGIQILDKNHLDREVMFCDENNPDKVIFVECGNIYPGLEMRVTDNDNKVLKECEIGRFQVKGKMVLPGYYNNPEVNEASFTEDGWFDTGDLAFIKGGSITFTGRMKDIIIVNGINYQNVDIETCVEEIEDVDVTYTAACAVNVDGESTDNVVVFYVPLVNGKRALKRQIEKIRETVFSTMGLQVRYVLPVTRDDIPKTNIGKIQRSKLVKRFQDGNFDELIKQLDIILDSEDVIRPWFFSKEYIKSTLNGKGNIDGKKIVIACNDENLGEKIGNLFSALGATCFIATNLNKCAEYINKNDCMYVLDFIQWFKVHKAEKSICDNNKLINMIDVHKKIKYFFVVHKKDNTGILDGYVKSLNQEENKYHFSIIQFNDVKIADVVNNLQKELLLNEVDDTVYYNENDRYIENLHELNMQCEMKEESKIKNSGKYIITGGIGGVGELVSRKLINDFDAELILVGRTRFENLADEQSIKYKKLLQLSKSLTYVAADISTEMGIQILTAAIEEKWNGELDGIFHLAGVGTFSGERDSEAHLCRNEKPECYEESFAAKEQGSINLAKIINKDTLFVNFASINGYFGGVSYSAYSAANSFISAYTDRLVAEGYKNCYCLNWSAWNGVGMSEHSMFIHAILEKGFIPILATNGIYSMLAVMRTDIHNILIGLDRTNYNIRKRMYNKQGYQLVSTLFCKKDYKEKVKKLIEENIIDEVIAIEEYPLDENGQIDKNKLYFIINTRDDDDELIELETETEKKLGDIWREILEIDKVGKNSNFFSLGGHSLNVTRLVARLKSEFGVKISVQIVFHQPILGRMATTIEQLSKNDNIKKTEIKNVYKDHYELSFAQKRVYLLETLEKQRGLYNIVSAWNMKGSIQLNKIQQAFTILVNRHQMLRATFKVDDGEPVQVVHDDMKIPIIVVNTKGLPQTMIDEKIEELMQNECRREYDLLNGPLMICTIIKKQEDDIIFIIGQHHIISDGWSFGVLVTELGQIYAELVEGKSIKLQPLDVQVANYIEWNNKVIVSSDVEKNYWIEKLKNNLEVLDLPLDYQRQEIQTYNGETLSFDIFGEQKKKLEKFNQANTSTMFMTMLSAYYLLLYKLSSQEDIVVGVPVAGREEDISKKLIGMFVNSLAIRNKIDDEKSLIEFVNIIKNSMFEAFEHQNYPFDKLVEDINPVRDLGRTPIFQTMFNYLSVPLKLEIAGVETSERIVQRKISKFDMSVNILDLDDRLNVSFEYNTDLFDKNSIRRWMGYFMNILNQIVNTPEKLISQIEIISTEERQKILSVNDNKTNYSREQSLAELFLEVVNKKGSRCALEFNGLTMTYSELNDKSDALANKLTEIGVVEGDIVSIDAQRNIDTIVGVLAIIKCGAAYLPLNKKYSVDVTQHMLDDCKVKYILTGSDNREHKNVQYVDMTLCYDTKTFSSVKGSKNKAYIIYTSGTTGVPKGVVVTHRNIVRLVKNTSWIDFQETDVILQTGALSFDASTFEIWGALLNGLTLCLVDNDCILDTQKLKQKISQNKVSIMWVSAPLFNQLVESDSSVFTGCRTLLVGGDILSVKHINKVRESSAGISIINGYGPTENTTFSTTFRIDKTYETSIPIGKPISNSTTYIVDKHMHLQPFGVIGELIVGGDGVAEGYLHQEELTKESFIENPFVLGEKAYRTGDFVRMTEDGNIQFIGRMDNQVKVRGFRIELNAIKNILLKNKKINDCVVMIREIQENKILVAYIAKNQDVSKAEVMDYLKKNVADYMLPSRIVILDEIPLNANGKVDTEKLRILEEDKLEEDYVVKSELSMNETETVFLEVYRNVLRNTKFGVTDSFFEWGGDSLLTIKLTSRLKGVGYHVDPKLVFMYQTIRELVRELSQMTEETNKIRKAEDYLILMHKGDDKKPNMFFIPPAGGTVLGYIELSKHFVKTGSAYGVQAPGLYEGEQPQYLSFDEMVDFCIKAIEGKYKPGKDYLAGHSLGGHFAYAMCYKLIQQGKAPKGLLILDTTPSLKELSQVENQDINEENFKLFVLTMGIGNMINGDTSRFENMSYEEVKEEIIKMSKSDETIASFMNENYLDKYLKMQLHHILLSREVELPKEKLDLSIHVVRTIAHEQYVKDLFEKWSEYTSKKVNIFDFNANHTSMMKLPYVIDLAAIVENIFAN